MTQTNKTPVAIEDNELDQANGGFEEVKVTLKSGGPRKGPITGPQPTRMERIEDDE